MVTWPQLVVRGVERRVGVGATSLLLLLMRGAEGASSLLLRMRGAVGTTLFLSLLMRGAEGASPLLLLLMRGAVRASSLLMLLMRVTEEASSLLLLLMRVTERASSLLLLLMRGALGASSLSSVMGVEEGRKAGVGASFILLVSAPLLWVAMMGAVVMIRRDDGTSLFVTALGRKADVAVLMFCFVLFWFSLV